MDRKSYTPVRLLESGSSAKLLTSATVTPKQQKVAWSNDRPKTGYNRPVLVRNGGTLKVVNSGENIESKHARVLKQRSRK